MLKKIGKGGTANAKELAAQMDYLFSKSASIFGNGVVLDADAKGLNKDERNDKALTLIGSRSTPDLQMESIRWPADMSLKKKS